MARFAASIRIAGRNGPALPEEREARRIPSDPESVIHAVPELDLAAAGVSSIIWASGNMLADTGVIDAMVAAFESRDGELDERLLAAMDTGLAAGGEMGPVCPAGSRPPSGRAGGWSLCGSTGTSHRSLNCA